MKQNYSIDHNRFLINDYQLQPTFSSFLPGIAGKKGIPLWAFYVNRGQGIVSFGSNNKDHAIMEFYPANKAYQNVNRKGFRTFIKIDGQVYEPFQRVDDGIQSTMMTSTDQLTIQEVNEALDLITTVNYFTLPNEPFAALCRQVTIKNLSTESRSIEVLDGMPMVIPYGVEHGALKEVSQTITAFTKVYNHEHKIPFYRLSASAEDDAKVDQLEAGNFYVATANGKLLEPIVDPKVIFKSDTSFEQPLGFIGRTLSNYSGVQKLENQFPCAFAGVVDQLGAEQDLTINSMIGHVKTIDALDTVKTKVLNDNYFDIKGEENQQVHQYYSDFSLTISADERFNGYTKQTFLDNILRGGFPIMVGEQTPKPYHVFSRKHGDLERDYNDFSLEPNYYSQGNGNFRDVNQNRRSDLYFNPKIKTHNIETFFNLIQLDGFNPLVLKSQQFVVKKDNEIEQLKKAIGDLSDELIAFISSPFTLGELRRKIDDLELDDSCFNQIIDASKLIINSEFGEGYWVDHWTYNLDLIENYLSIYPETLERLLTEKKYTFYDSYVKVLPRDKKQVLTDRGPRQYDALYEDEQKKQLIEQRTSQQHAVRLSFGKGDIYYTNLTVKIFALLLNKIASLDPEGIGIVMEANRPGWYDALNGLPGLFGSSFGETAEVLRWVRFMKKALQATTIEKIKLPVEIYQFYQGIEALLDQWQIDQNNFNYWDESQTLKETYRTKIFNGIHGAKEVLTRDELMAFYSLVEEKLLDSKNRARNDNGLYTMFYSYAAVDYEETDELSPEGLPFVNIKTFEQQRLSNFLEGQVKGMKIASQPSIIQALHENVLTSDLYDEKLKMFRVNGHLENESYEIGRAKAFSPGWLENGSVWLHMEYKYILELLKKGLYETFYEVFESAGILYQAPERYKRSIFENSSFILSSLNSDEDNHGRGYIARLSGATAEYLQMWTIMAFGDQPFLYKDGNLTFKPSPVLKGRMFTTEEQTMNLHISETEKQKVSFAEDTFTVRFLGHTLVTYHNPSRKDTFGEQKAAIDHYALKYNDGSTQVINESTLVGAFAEDLRNGNIEKVDIYLK